MTTPTTPTNPEGLSPCPFCDAKGEYFDGDFKFEHKAGCHFGVGTIWIVGKYQFEKWNTRAHPTPPSDGAAAAINSPDSSKRGDAAHGDTAGAAALPEGVMSAEDAANHIAEMFFKSVPSIAAGFQLTNCENFIRTRDAQLSQATGELPEIKDVIAEQHHRPDLAPDAMVCHLSAPGYRQMTFDNAVMRLDFPTCVMRVLDWLHNYKLPTALQASDEVDHV